MVEEVGDDRRRVKRDFLFNFFTAFIPVLFPKFCSYPVPQSILATKKRKNHAVHLSIHLTDRKTLAGGQISYSRTGLVQVKVNHTGRQTSYSRADIIECSKGYKKRAISSSSAILYMIGKFILITFFFLFSQDYDRPIYVSQV